MYLCVVGKPRRRRRESSTFREESTVRKRSRQATQMKGLKFNNLVIINNLVVILKFSQMKKSVFFIIPALIIGVILISCNSDVLDETVSTAFFYKVENVKGEDIATVQAKVSYFRLRTENQVQWETYYYKEYVIADFAKYKNGTLELNLSATIPDEYLFSNSEKVWPTHGYSFSEGVVVVSDIDAKTNHIVFLEAFNSAGKRVGEFYFGNHNNFGAEYIYADRGFTENGISEGNWQRVTSEFDCSYEKGWNIRYRSGSKYTTKKPTNEDLKCYFEPQKEPLVD